jgi:hypothetical protein
MKRSLIDWFSVFAAVVGEGVDPSDFARSGIPSRSRSVWWREPSVAQEKLRIYA